MIARFHRFVPPLFAGAVRSLIAALLLAGSLAAATAQGEPPAPGGAVMQVQVTLTPDLIERFIASWPDFAELGDALADSHGVDETVTTPTAAFAAWARSPDAKARIDALVAKYGFASLQEWSMVADSVMLAFTYDEEELSDERLAEVIAGVEASADVPADQKAVVIAQVRDYFAAARTLKPLPGNAEAIEPYLDDLAAITGGSSSGPDEPQDAPNDEPEGEPGATQD